MVDRFCTLIATGCQISYIPFALLGRRKWTGAGFLGTLEGMALTPWLPSGGWPLGLFLSAAILAACWVCGRAERSFGGHDDPRIVLDEVVGYWTTVAFLPGGWKVWVAGFVLFRLFDSFKLPPWKWLEALPGGAGVVGDDVGAGVAANLALRGLLVLWPQWF